MTTIAPRRRAGQRISAAVWGLLVIGAGALSIAAYSGYEIDVELIVIVVLAALGGWLLLSAAVSGLGRKREVRAATAPTIEETVDHGRSANSAPDTSSNTLNPSAARHPDGEGSDEPDVGESEPELVQTVGDDADGDVPADQAEDLPDPEGGTAKP